jgi:predicted NAD-dependent protein-ADP-ribosyltransferase YbiA (DUF1768 family)
LTQENTILFYSHHEDKPYWWWSNFANFPVYYEGNVWRNSEAPFQWKKYSESDPEQAELVRRALTPHDAAALGRDRSRKLRSDWDQPVQFELPEALAANWERFVGVPMLTKDWIMLEVVRCKVAQHAELQERLLETGTATLVEHTTKDSYWADGGDGSGKNMLGKILMVVREEYRK